MSARALSGLTLLAPLLLAACASPERTSELAQIDPRAGYRYEVLEAQAPKAIEKTGVILTFSGGGTRAAALADGVLRAFAATKIPVGGAMQPFADQIDLVSSVSGGSVTAAYFALNGLGGLDAFERDFLKSDIMGTLIGRTLRNPGQLLYPRIDILDDYLDQVVFKGKTYQDLIAADRPADGRRPYVVLNAADMAVGSVFSFNQDQFDLICADLSKLKIADAVSASAAFPGALSALTLKNRAPCAAQRAAPTQPRSGWQMVAGTAVPTRVANDVAAENQDGVAYPAAQNLARSRRGSVALTYLNPDHRADYIQLLDGGIADNLGLTLPLTLLTSPSQSPSFQNWINTGKMTRLLLVVVNARGDASNEFGRRDRPPGLVDTLTSVVGTSIDATSYQLLDHLDEIAGTRLALRSLVLVDLDFIADSDCRQRFQNMATSWTLPPSQVTALIELGEAMVLQSPDYLKMVQALGGVAPPPAKPVPEVCRELATAS